MAKNYIQPNLTKHNSFKELSDYIERYSFYGSSLINRDINLNDILSERRAFVISEPGLGKTRLLKELVLKALTDDKKGIFIDLKQINKEIDEYIEDKKNSIETIDQNIIEENLNKLNFFKLKSFALEDSNKLVICLDALDEVSTDNFSDVIERIKDFSQKFENIYLLISCRIHYIKKYADIFANSNFKYFYIEPFYLEQIQKYLELSGFSTEDIGKILDIFESPNAQISISIPRYLVMFVDYINTEGFKKISTISKGELFEYFIYKKLDIEEKKINKQYKDITKRVLEKLALLMEIYQTNKISKDELMSFFDDINSNLNIYFLNQVDLNIFFERSLLKDNINSVEFENTSFQEYLASKEIIRLGRVDQIVFDLAFDPVLREIYPSWYNTLEYLIELYISIVKPILEFGKKEAKIVEESSYHWLLTTINPKRLPLVDRKLIFEYVFLYYQEKLHWINKRIARKLAYYFDISQHDLLKKYIDGRKSKDNTRVIRRANVAHIITYIFDKRVLTPFDIDYWKKKMIEFTKDKNGELKGRALIALSNFNNLNLIKKVRYLIDNYDKNLNRKYLEICMTINPNDPFSIKCFVEGIKKHLSVSFKGINRINEKKSLLILFDYLKSDKRFTTAFLSPKSSFRTINISVCNNLLTVWDKDIQNKVEDFIKIIISDDDIHDWRFSKFFYELLTLIKNKNKNIIISLINEIESLIKDNKKLLMLPEVLAILINKDNVERFVNKLKQIDQGKRIAIDTLHHIKFSKRYGSDEEIYEEGRKYFSKEYDEFEKRYKLQIEQVDYNKSSYYEFIYKLEPEKNKYYPDVFSFFLENKNDICKFITSDDLERLKDLIINSIFEIYDPIQKNLIIEQKRDKGMRYTTDQFIHVFGDCLKIAKELNIDVSKYRKKIIGYIPFAYYEYLEVIFSLIKDLTNDEINILIDIYSVHNPA